MHSFILGIVQGLTEFLPVSSSGHIILFDRLFNMHMADVDFVAMLHLGTFFAVLLFSLKSIIRAFKHWKIIINLIISTLPAAIFGVVFEKEVDSVFSDIIYLPIFFCITSALLWLTGLKKVNTKKMEDMNWLDALLVGLMQAAAIFPGISRSGSTLAVLIFMGYEKEDALYYSFLMSLPVVLGAVVFSFNKNVFMQGIMGFVSSLLFGILALVLLKKIVKNGKLKYFSIYTLSLAVFILFYNMIVK